MVVYTVTCAILGHRNAFSVEIDSDKPVSTLKSKIRAEQFQALRSFQASDLKLYKINIPVTPTYNAAIEPIYQRTINFNEGDELADPTAQLEEVFLEGAPRKTIHVLVKVPEGEPIDSRASGSYIFVAGVVPMQQPADGVPTVRHYSPEHTGGRVLAAAYCW